MRTHSAKALEIFRIGIRAAVLLIDKLFVLGRTLDRREEAGELARKDCAR